MRTQNTPLINVDRVVSRREVIVGAGVGAAAAAVAARPAFARQDARTTPASTENSITYSFHVGDVQCHSVSDGSMISPGSPHPLFGKNATREEVEEIARNAFLDPSSARFYFNVLVVRAADQTLIVDSGFGSLGGPSAGKLEAGLAALGIRPDDVTGVVISHLHPDHFGGIRSGNGELRFAKARYFIRKQERDFWSENPDLSKNGVDEGMRKGMVGGAQATLKALDGRLDVIDADAEVSPGIRLVHAPGHTPGHQMLRVESGGALLLMWADVAHNFAISLARPDFHMGFDTDPVQGAQTRRAVMDRAASERVLVMGYHTPFPGLGRVERVGDGRFRWNIEPWQP
ncbi:MAG TPA: MBL fold metallo-hydrolase [Phycisphaerales bacterium]|nr:MBL fold metallo-hydrolase [Phycisphaerales bacterium]